MVLGFRFVLEALGFSQTLKPKAAAATFITLPEILESHQETYYSVKRDLLQCQKRPTIASKETLPEILESHRPSTIYTIKQLCERKYFWKILPPGAVPPSRNGPLQTSHVTSPPPCRRRFYGDFGRIKRVPSTHVPAAMGWKGQWENTFCKRS